MSGIFVIGADTGVGKTIVCAGILSMLTGPKKPVYWKPIQTGTLVGDDTADMKSLTQLPEENFVDPLYKFTDPLAPPEAAKKWGKQIELKALTAAYDSLQKAGKFTIIEGAGGVLVPFAEDLLQIDFIAETKLPVMVVAQDRIGAINQTLLTLWALRERKVPIAGVVLTRSRGQMSNAESIRHFGKVDVLAEIQPTDDKRSLVALVGGHPGLRKYFHVPVLPV